MSGLHEAWETIPVEGDFSLITADEVRSLSGREPRLVMKFDHSHQLPPKLGLQGRFILPLRNGLYAILRGPGYHRPEPCPPIVDFPRQTFFHLGTSVGGISEMQHLDLAFNTGLLSEFLGEPVLYPTIRGRKRSPHFTFSVDGRPLEVEGVQVEIDGGYEGRDCVVVVEAKIGECEDFHLRQIYYPYRFWLERSDKPVRPVFFTYDPVAEIYRFREYTFDPPEVYGPPRLLKAAAYRLVEPTMPSRQTAPVKATIPIPQADKLSRIAEIPVLVALGYNTPGSLSERLEFEHRQGSYYLDAACSLGLLERASPYALTDLGRAYVCASPPLREAILARSVLGVPLIQELLVSLLLAPGARISKADLLSITQRSTTLSGSTAKRRAQTLWAWLVWVSERGAHLQIKGDEISLKAPQLPDGQARQLRLFSP